MTWTGAGWESPSARNSPPRNGAKITYNFNQGWIKATLFGTALRQGEEWRWGCSRVSALFPNKACFSSPPPPLSLSLSLFLSATSPPLPTLRPPPIDSARTLSTAVQSFDTQRSLASWHCGDRATPSSIHCYRATTKTAKPPAPNPLQLAD